MHRRLIFGFLILLGVFISYSLFIEWRDSIWQKPFNEAIASYSKGNYLEAEKVILKSLPEVERRWPNGAPVAYQMYALALAYDGESKSSKAEEKIRRSIEIRETMRPPDPVASATSHSELGRIYMQKNGTPKVKGNCRKP